LVDRDIRCRLRRRPIDPHDQSYVPVDSLDALLFRRLPVVGGVLFEAGITARSKPEQLAHRVVIHRDMQIRRRDAHVRVSSRIADFCRGAIIMPSFAADVRLESLGF
jgi:hypothetical protein